MTIEKSDSSYILFETPNVVCIATGFKTKSKNTKTGGMVQVWFLVKNYHPMTAIKNDADRSVCFDCKYRMITKEVKNNKVKFSRKCYVNLMKAPANIWRAYQRDRYSILSDYSVFNDRFVRFGTYGEPVLTPIPMIKEIIKHAAGFTGYTHQWKNPVFQGYKQYFMASCDETDYQLAESMGWRTFIVSNKHINNHIQCPASAERNHVTTCLDCGLCNGLTNTSMRSIQIRPHGQQKKAFDIN